MLHTYYSVIRSIIQPILSHFFIIVQLRKFLCKNAGLYRQRASIATDNCIIQVAVFDKLLSM